MLGLAKMFDWKIIFAVFAALLLLGGGLIKDVGTNLEEGDLKNIIRTVKDKVGNIISMSDFKVPVKRDLSVKGELHTDNEFKFKSSGADLSLRYPPSDTNVTVDGKSVRIEREIADFNLEKFRGDISLSPEDIDIEGKSSSVNSESFNFEGEGISVRIDGEYNRIRIINIEIEKMELSNSTGELHIGTSVTVSPKDKPFILHGFLGNLTFSEGDLKLQGKINKASSGEEDIAVSMFPGI